MPSLQDELKRLNEKLQEITARGQAENVKPLDIQDLIGTHIPAPIPIGGTAQQGFAPRGAQLNFTGGLTHRPNNTGAILNNALNAVFAIRGEINKLKKKQKAQGANTNGGA